MPVSRSFAGGIQCRRPPVVEKLFGCAHPIQKRSRYCTLPVQWFTSADIVHLQQGCNGSSVGRLCSERISSSILPPFLSSFFLLFWSFFYRITSETRYHHVLGFLWQWQQLGRVQRGRRCPQQRLLPGCSHGGAARLPALHHFSYPLHRWVSKTGEN